MAYILSLPVNPLERTFVESHRVTTRSAGASQQSTGSTQHQCQQSPPISWPLSEDTARLDYNRLGSKTVLNFVRDFGLDFAPPLSPSINSSIHDAADYGFNQISESGIKRRGSVRRSEDATIPFPPLEGSLGVKLSDNDDHIKLSVPEHSTHCETLESSPFRRWLSTVRGKHDQRVPRGHFRSSNPARSPRGGHHRSLSLSSSMGILTGIQSTSLTAASTSIAPTSRHGRQSQLHSDNTSQRNPRLSVDSNSAPIETTIDSKAWYRSIQRRNIVEEIVQSEESYIADMKAMVHVYFTLLASTPSLSPRKKESIQKSVTQIIELHEDLLAELQRIVPSCSDLVVQSTPQRRLWRSKHTRWQSADNGIAGSRHASHRRCQRSVDMTRSTSPISRFMVSTTNTVLNVAKVFDRFTQRFLAYRAYAAFHEIVHDGAAATSRLIPTWPIYERGVEALSSFVNALEQKEICGRKGMTLADLGIKPIQRICKYPLLFSDLCKHTPACDDPIVHAELEKVLSRLQETAEEIDSAMNNPRMRHLIETTWILQERLTLRGECTSAQATCIRALGHMVLCGVLHAAYETSDQIRGRYTICILYRAYLVLASVGNSCNVYLIDAIVPLLGAAVEAPGNGRGLQCHTASHTWTLCFSYQYKHYEILFSACSDIEEDVWKSQLRLSIAAEARDAEEGRHTSTEDIAQLAIGMKPAGIAFDLKPSLVRRHSIRRAATLGPKTSLRQVIIKNTHTQRPGQHESEDCVQVLRSKSHLSVSHIPTLAPRRAERIRLENMLADVWSKDAIPYPGMATRRPENTIRASANSVMRKLSMASIASNFSSSKRCGSFSGTVAQSAENRRTPSPRTLYHSSAHGRRLEKRRSRTAVVDFHNAPNAFLPEDFELKKHTLGTRGQNFMTRAMTMEGTRTPPQIFPSEPLGSHKRSMSLSASARLKVPASTPLDSEDCEYISWEPVPTTVQTKLSENKSPQLSAKTQDRPPSKVKGRLFKLLGVNNGKGE